MNEVHRHPSLLSYFGHSPQRNEEEVKNSHFMVRPVWPDSEVICSMFDHLRSKKKISSGQRRFKILLNTKKSFQNFAKDFNNLPKWQSLAKSGHFGRETIYYQEERKGQKGGAKNEMKKWNPFQPWLSPFSGCETLPIKEFYHSTQKERQQPVWPDWAILKVLGYNFFQKIAQMFFNYLGSFEKHHVLSKIIFGYILGNFWNILGCFYFSIWSHYQPQKIDA